MKTKSSSIEPLNTFTAVILDSAITVHKEMGPGLLEQVYHHCLVKELRDRDLQVESMVPVPLYYRA